MKLDLSSLEVQSFSLESTETSTTTTADTGPAGPHSYCYICYETDPGWPGCGVQPAPAPAPKPWPYDPLDPYRSLVVDSKCMCYA